jgi:hypothetical protein
MCSEINCSLTVSIPEDQQLDLHGKSKHQKFIGVVSTETEI